MESPSTKKPEPKSNPIQNWDPIHDFTPEQFEVLRELANGILESRRNGGVSMD
jgi:hypothetical protein